MAEPAALVGRTRSAGRERVDAGAGQTRARRHLVRFASLLCALALGACPQLGARPRIAYFERAGELPALGYHYFPLKVAARAGRVAVLDGAPTLGFKNSRILLLDATTGTLLSSTEIPRGTRRDAKGSALAADARGRFYAAIEGQGETHLLRLTPPPRPAKLPNASNPPSPAKSAALTRGRPRGAATVAATGARSGQQPTEEWDAIRAGRSPTGLLVDEAEQVWLVDGGNHRIIRLAWKGDDPAVFGSSRELDVPRGAALDKEGVFYTRVAGPKQSRVFRYDSKGALLGSFVVPGLEDPLAWFHNDLAFDREGRLYLTDFARSRVLVFTTDGKPAGEIRDPAFKGPMGLCFDEEDVLFIADAWAKQVLRFRPVYEKEAAERAAAAKRQAIPRTGNEALPPPSDVGGSAPPAPSAEAPADAGAPKRR